MVESLSADEEVRINVHSGGYYCGFCFGVFDLPGFAPRYAKRGVRAKNQRGPRDCRTTGALRVWEKYFINSPDGGKRLACSDRERGTDSFTPEDWPRENVVVALGKVEDLGREAGYILISLGEMRSLAAVAASTLSAGQRGRLLDLQRRYADMLGILPVIAGFQNNPVEYGKFFANLAKQSAGLNESQTAQVDAYMRARASEMIQAGLNEANKPVDPVQMDAWESRRDQFNTVTVAGLRQVVSPQIADRAGIDGKLMEFLETDFDKSGMTPGSD